MNEAGLKKHMGGFAGSLKELYFFVALAGKVQVLHGWKVLWAISGSGQQLVGLIGDCHIAAGGNITPPSLCVADGAQANQ